MKINALFFLLFLMTFIIPACKEKPKEKSAQPIIYKGIYSFDAGEKSFRGCNEATAFWVVDSSNKLELQYSQLGVSEQPVYIEVTGEKVASVKKDSVLFDSTLVVYKVVKMTKEIPASCK